MLEYDFINVLRLDGCFRFLNLGLRIHLHQSQVSNSYFESLAPETKQKLLQMRNVLESMQWQIPAFHNLRETENAVIYYVFKSNQGEISESQYAEIYQEEFEIFKQNIL